MEDETNAECLDVGILFMLQETTCSLLAGGDDVSVSFKCHVTLEVSEASNVTALT